MNRQKALTLPVFLILSGAMAFAQEAGVDSTTGFTLVDSPSTTITAAERLDGWWKLPLGTNGSLFEGSAHVGGSVEIGLSGGSSTWLPTGDIDRLRLALVFPNIVPDLSRMYVELGRLAVKDAMGLIVLHPADGALIGFEYPFIKVSVQAGSTALMLRNANSIVMSLYDQTASADATSWLGTSRLLYKATAEFPDILKQSVNLSFIAQQDTNPASAFIPLYTQTRDTNDPPLGGRLDTQYSSIQVSGPLIPKMFYDAFFTYGSGRTLSWVTDAVSESGYSYQYVPISSFLTGVSLEYFMPALLSAAFNFRFLFASGDADYTAAIEGNSSGNGTMFIPITSSTLGAVFSPALSNLMVAQLTGSVKPFPKERIQTGLKLFAFMRPTTGALDATGLEPGGDSPWLGFETDVFANYRISSDLGLSLSTGIFMPGEAPTGAFTDGSAQFSMNVALTLGM